MIIKGTYVGIRKRLQDKTALIQLSKDGQSLTAQFDDLRVAESHGWHKFDRKDFILELQTCSGKLVK